MYSKPSAQPNVNYYPLNHILVIFVCKELETLLELILFNSATTHFLNTTSFDYYRCNNFCSHKRSIIFVLTGRRF